MMTWVRIGWAFVWQGAVLIGLIMLGIGWVNGQSKPWDGRAHYLKNDDAIVGTPGVLVVTLAQPSRYDGVFYINFMEKLFGDGGVIPWPIAPLAGADAGIALMDPTRAYAPERFEPTTLADVNGRTVDIDGVPFVEKWRQGRIRWVKPSASVPYDTGFFLYPERKGGMRTASAKVLLKARYLYYAALPNGYLPHGDQTNVMAQAALDGLKASRPDVPSAVVDGFNPHAMRLAVRSVLDAGADTVVLSSILPIHSDFEELRGSFSKVYKHIEDWRKDNGGKPVKIVIADAMSADDAFYDSWAAVLDRNLPPAASPDSPLTLIVTYHGLPLSLIDKDIWSKLRLDVDKRMHARFSAVAAAKGYRKVAFVDAMEGFSEGPEDPENKLLGVGEAFRAEIEKKTPLAIAVPIEFLSENTDTLFAHAVTMFEGLPGYAPYKGPPADVNWLEGYPRSFQVGGTTLIYTGSGSPADQAVAARALANVLTATVGPRSAAAGEAPRG